jgi:hypothetical protein
VQQAKARVHHAEPFIVSREIYCKCTNGFSEPFLDGWVVNVIVVNPAFVASVIWRINEDAFDFASIVG